MPWSMPIAEPIGAVVGIVCGRLAASHGRKLAKEWGWPEILGGVAGAALGHYIGNSVTKLVINAVMMDATGAAANVAVTSPTSSLAHALFEGFSEVLPNLDGDTTWQAIQEAFTTPEASDALQAYTGVITSSALPDGYYPYSDRAMLQAIVDS